MDLSRPTKYPKNELLIKTLIVPSRVDKLTCHSITANSIFEDYEYYSFSEIHGHFNCLQAISLQCLSETLKSCQALQQIITYSRNDRF